MQVYNSKKIKGNILLKGGKKILFNDSSFIASDGGINTYWDFVNEGSLRLRDENSTDFVIIDPNNEDSNVLTVNGNIVTYHDIIKENRHLFIPFNSFIAYGDSQTEGFNFSGKPYTDGGSYLLEAYKWVNIFANSYGKFLNYDNRAVGGSRISWKNSGATYSHEHQSHFNKMGNLRPNWTGLVVSMLGWNNLGVSFSTEQEKTDFFEVMKSAQMSCIARMLIDNYGGIANVGWDSNYNTYVNSWSTDGTGVVEYSPFVANTEFLPFRYNADVLLNGRWHTKLEDGDFLQFTLNSKRACGLFFETGVNGGEFNVLVNGIVYGSYNSNYTPLTGYDGDVFPFVVWIENLPDNSVIRVEQTDTTTKEVRFLAYGYVERDSVPLSSKMLLVGSVCGNNYLRNSEIIYRMWLATKEAVGCFSDYSNNLKFVDVAKHWQGYKHQEPSDLSHLTDIGNVMVAESFQKNIENPVLSFSNKLIKL
ncbi:hypothetical protein ACFSKN_02125 [Mariniflexile gromovii]|uniref:Uncharacterized protein n=1 Tax=Mariniflexile gromovii TaxID=362523 RepID=A0ABS4BP74_9FLAO|nr:hypothetical protein [Mariniflexile gromovii]MBP0902399.1 hypothetical protein [Mariniflexile gromovii]